jgi:hypothetical protein
MESKPCAKVSNTGDMNYDETLPFIHSKKYQRTNLNVDLNKDKDELHQ